jgi:hypothetical protein
MLFEQKKTPFPNGRGKKKEEEKRDVHLVVFPSPSSFYSR